MFPGAWQVRNFKENLPEINKRILYRSSFDYSVFKQVLQAIMVFIDILQGEEKEFTILRLECPVPEIVKHFKILLAKIHNKIVRRTLH